MNATQNEPADTGSQQSSFTDVSRLRRTRGDRKIAGVAGGIARHLDIDPIIVRVLLVVLIFFGGSGLLIYAGFWALVPIDGTDSAPIRTNLRSRSAGLTIVLGLAGLAMLGDVAAGWGFPWGLLVLGIVLVAVLQLRRDDPPVTSTPDGYPPAAMATAPTTGSMTPPPAPVLRTGLVLFWPTLALLAITLGGMGLLDAAGVDILPSVYPGVGLAIVALMLLVGSVWGRAGGLIALGLAFGIATAATTAAEGFDPADVDAAPTTAEDALRTYDFSAGEVKLDLTDVRDLESLDGEVLRIRGGLGEVTITVPDELSVTGEAELRTVGSTTVFGQSQDSGQTVDRSAGADAPTLEIDVSMGVGEITIEDER